jgi:hypothetical protein
MNPTQIQQPKKLKWQKTTTHVRPRPRRIHNPTLQHVRGRAHGGSHRTRRKARSKVAEDVVFEHVGFEEFGFEKVVSNGTASAFSFGYAEKEEASWGGGGRRSRKRKKGSRSQLASVHQHSSEHVWTDTAG